MAKGTQRRRGLGGLCDRISRRLSGSRQGDLARTECVLATLWGLLGGGKDAIWPAAGGKPPRDGRPLRPQCSVRGKAHPNMPESTLGLCGYVSL